MRSIKKYFIGLWTFFNLTIGSTVLTNHSPKTSTTFIFSSFSFGDTKSDYAKAQKISTYKKKIFVLFNTGWITLSFEFPHTYTHKTVRDSMTVPDCPSGQWSSTLLSFEGANHFIMYLNKCVYDKCLINFLHTGQGSNIQKSNVHNHKMFQTKFCNL